MSDGIPAGWSLPSHPVRYAQYETIKEGLTRGNMTAVYKNNLFFPGFVIVTQHAPAKHFLNVCSCEKTSTLRHNLL